MSHPVVIPWLPSAGNEAAIAPVQTLAAGGPLTLMVNVPNLPQGPYKFDRVVRSLVVVTDGNNTNFTINGIGSPVDDNGNPTQIYAPISEDILAARGANVSVNIYTQIDSIVIDQAAQVSVGFGTFGITDYVFLDYNRTMFQASVQLQFITPTTMTVTVYQSLSKPQTPNGLGNLDNFQPYRADPGPPLVPSAADITIPAFAVSADLTNATTNQLGALGVIISPVTVVWATITNNTQDSLYFTVLQQGLRS